MAYNTGNTVGSSDFRDLSDNAVNFDKYSVGADPAYPNRLGVLKLSIEGMNQEFNNAQDGRQALFETQLGAMGYTWLAEYGPGLVFTSRNQYLVRDGLAYTVANSTTLPYTTTGNWATEVSKFKAVSVDDILRADLANSAVGKGAALVAYQGRTVAQWLADRYTVSGAVAGGTIDATSVIQAAIDALPTGATLDGNNLAYLVTKLNLKSDMRLANFRLITKAGAPAGQFWSPVTVGAYNDTTLRQNIEIENVHVNGQRVLNETGTTGGEDGGKHGFRFIGRISNLTVRNCSAMACGSYGFFNFLGISSGSDGSDTPLQTNINYINCIAMFNKAHGLAADSIDGLNIDNCKFTENGKDITGSSGGRITEGGVFYGNGIDLEGYGIDSRLINVTIRNTDLTNNKAASIFISDPVLKTATNFKMRGGFLIQNCKLSSGASTSNTPDTALAVLPPYANWTLGAIYDDIKVLGCVIQGNIDIVDATGVVLDSPQKHTGTYLGAVAYATITVNNEIGAYFDNQAASTINYRFEFGTTTDANSNVNWFRKEADGWIRQGLFSTRVDFAANEEKSLTVNYLRGLHGNAHSTTPSIKYISSTAAVYAPIVTSAGDSSANILVKNGPTAQKIGVYCEIAGK